MNSTALRAGAQSANNTHMVFANEEHEKFYYEKLEQVRYQGCYHKALIYILGISEDTRNHFSQIYDIKSGYIKTECLHQGWQTSGSVRVVTGICFLALTKLFILIAIYFIMATRRVIFMNMNIISKYLQFLRKSNNYTQDDLAKELGISRQAVSKWETGTTIPDLEILLKISKLYDITINDILEPKVQSQRITDFEQISTISEKELKEVLEQFDTNSLVTALMGASPETNSFCERLFPDIDFEMTRKNIGRIRIETVEDMQNQIIAMINLQAVDKEI